MNNVRKTSKVLALLMAMILTVSLFVTATPVLAIEPDATGSITVSGVEDGVTVSAYRLMTVKVNANGQPQDPVYTWVSEIADWVSSEYPQYIDTANNSVKDAFNNDDLSAEEKAEFYDKLAAEIKSNKGSLNIAGTCTGNGTIEKLPMGNYLILIEKGMKVYRPSAVNLVPVWNEDTSAWVMSEAEVVVKSSEPSITKTVNDKEADNETIGKNVSFKVVTDVPQFPANALAKNYEISDTLPGGLTLDATTIAVKGIKGEDETDLAAGAYTLTTTDAKRHDNTPVTFNIKFTYDQIKAYDKIEVTYTAMLNGSAVLVTGNVNTAYLDYSNDPYTAKDWESKDDSATVYTYGLDISKVDKDDNTKFLSGAEFELYATENDAVNGTNKISFVKTGDGVYRVATATDASNTTTTTLVVGKADEVKGKLVIKGLDEATWYLKETKAPEGYNLLNAPVEVTITDADEGVLDGKVDNAAGNEGDDPALVQLTVKNDDGFRLPITGGMGTVLFSMIGIVLMGAAVILFILALKKRKISKKISL